jgi:hypothetical protein
MKGELRLITDEGDELYLKNVLYIPGFDNNFLNAMQLIKNGNQIIFNSPSSGYIQQATSDHRIVHLVTTGGGDHNMLHLNCICYNTQTVMNQAT